MEWLKSLVICVILGLEFLVINTVHVVIAEEDNPFADINYSRVQQESENNTGMFANTTVYRRKLYTLFASDFNKNKSGDYFRFSGGLACILHERSLF